MESWLEEKSVVRNKCVINRDSCTLKRTVEKSGFKNFSQSIKSYHGHTSSGKKATAVTFLISIQSWTGETSRSILAFGEKELDCCLVVQSPFSDENKLCFSLGNQSPKGWMEESRNSESIFFFKQSVEAIWTLTIPVKSWPTTCQTKLIKKFMKT